MAAVREPPKFHVVSAWHSTRYPGPDAEETGYPIAVPSTPPAPSSSPMVSSTAPVSRPLAEAPSPPQIRPEPAPAPSPRGLYDLSGLLGRLWLSPPEKATPVAPPTSSHDSRATDLGKGSAPEPPEPTATLLAAAPISAPSIRPISEPQNLSNEPSRTRWARAWICPRCRLTNAPWSKACTACRAAAPAP